MSYQFLPALSDAEYDALRADIAANGMRHPILVDEKGKILDGHHRARIAAELGFKPEREVLAGLTEQEKRDTAFTLNTARRNLDQAGRRNAVIASIKADPELSDRQHARRTGVSHSTVAVIRAELVATGRVVDPTTRIDAGGRSQPATKTPARRDPEPAHFPGPAVATPGEPDQPEGAVAVGEDAAAAPSAEPPPLTTWDPAERAEHDAAVRRTQEIDAGHRAVKSVLSDLRTHVITIVSASRLGEHGLVTKELITGLRRSIDMLEEEIDQ